MTVHWTQFALDQLMEIADALAERSADRARAVVQRILDRVGEIAQLPYRFAMNRRPAPHNPR